MGLARVKVLQNSFLPLTHVIEFPVRLAYDDSAPVTPISLPAGHSDLGSEQQRQGCLKPSTLNPKPDINPKPPKPSIPQPSNPKPAGGPLQPGPNELQCRPARNG